MELTRLIVALADPAAYRDPVEAVEVRQTHISAVFLAGPFVYKLKKPVVLPFLDFGTLEKRRHFCAEEVRLNRRLAPHVYLGVVPVVRTGQGVRVEGEGEVVEWAVKMQRLPDDATVQERLRRGQVGIDLVEALARRIAAFHREADAHERTAAFGQYEVVARVINDVFSQAAPQVGASVHPGVFARVKTLAEEALTRLRPVIAARAARGVPRDCHGDLHLDHVYYFPERPPPADLVIIDCIEFNERFRFIDPVADMAFPAMDLAFHGRRDLARGFADAYFRASCDEEGRALLPLYTAYRAAVRGAVEGLLLAEKEVPDAERAAALTRARAHWLLALTELEAPARKPCLVLVTGLPGTGKSTLARGLADRGDFCVIRSDVVRKQMAGVGPTTTLPEALYTPQWDDRTYAECLRRAERLLFAGRRVIIDATFREEHRRRAFLDGAIRWGVPAALLHCQVKRETAQARLQARQGDASDAGWAVYQKLARSWEAAGDLTRRFAYPLDTNGTPQEVLDAALAVLRTLDLQG